MRTTIELPDDLMIRAKVRAAEERLTLKELFISAIDQRLAGPGATKKHRRGIPVIYGGPVRDATPEELAEAVAPIQHIIDEMGLHRRSQSDPKLTND